MPKSTQLLLPSNAPVVLITGITGGFGRAFATVFRTAGYRIAGLARQEPAEHDWEWFFRADLTDAKDRHHVLAAIRHRLPGLDVVIHNAGVGLYDRWECTDEKELRRLMELNLFAPILLTQELLPLLKQSGGTVITVSSAGGRIPVPVMGAYCMSKSALSSFADSLRAELAHSNVHVLDLVVGRINTGFSSRAMGSQTPPETPFSGSADRLARHTVRALRRKKRRIVYPGWYRMVMAVRALAPGLFDRMAMKKWQSP